MHSRKFNFLIIIIIYGFFLSNAYSNDNKTKLKKLNPIDAVPFSMSISGGVSLGSYEAGINWALSHYLRIRRDAYQAGTAALYPDLRSITGASAGSINTLITAISWCIDDSRLKKNNSTEFHDKIDNNLFRDIWVNVGIEDLLPNSSNEKKSKKAKYKIDDGLFSRNAFDDVILKLRTVLKQPVFRNDCVIPFGMTVTGVNPNTITVAGITVENQRFIIPLRLESSHKKDGTVFISSHIVNHDDPFMGNVIYLQGQKDSAENNNFIVTVDNLIDVVLTSSAFPIAFGRKELHYCARVDPFYISPLNNCPTGYKPSVDEFLDGGVFDNVPLGVAKALSEPKPTDDDSNNTWKLSARRYNYIYIDPDNRRIEFNKDDAANSKIVVKSTNNTPLMSFGIKNQLKFLNGAINTGRYYELYTTLRAREWSSQTYPFACKLYSTIHRVKNHSCIPSYTVSIKRCKTLYRNIESDKKLSTKELKDISICLLESSYDLEKEYSTKIVNSKLKNLECNRKYKSTKPGHKILNIRHCLLSRLAILSKQLNLGQTSYEIHDAIDDELGDRRILLTTRFADITGSKLENFGAFMDSYFREYDYYAGIYDALNRISSYFCERSRQQACMANNSKQLFKKFKIAETPVASVLITALFKDEYLVSDNSNSPWNWLNEVPESYEDNINIHNIKIIFKTLLEIENNKDSTNKTSSSFDEFVLFLRTLLKNGYDVSHSSSFMKRVQRLEKSDPLSWFYPITTSISSRLITLEAHEVDINNESDYFSLLLGVSSLAVHTYVKNEDNSLFSRSTAPLDTWQRYLPYEVGVDVRNGGVKIAWEPSIYIAKNYSLDINITPVGHNRFASKNIFFSQVNLYLSWQTDSWFSSIGIGPSYTYSWKEDVNAKQNNVGASIYMGFVRDKIRITAGQRSFTDSYFSGDSSYYMLSVTDIPGFVYWLGQ
ncbi:MAG: patatin-like phospholipase family protein [Gammaproteobacteria bacterium]